jgi:hypothetical protein
MSVLEQAMQKKTMQRLNAVYQVLAKGDQALSGKKANLGLPIVRLAQTDIPRQHVGRDRIFDMERQ